MGKEFLGVRIEPEIKERLEKVAESNGETVTDIVERALQSFLKTDTDKPDLFDLSKRVQALESKFSNLQSSRDTRTKKREPKRTKKEDSKNFGELVTVDEAEKITGYSKATLSSKFSKAGIKAVDRVDGNRAGLYDKNEILKKIGKK